MKKIIALVMAVVMVMLAVVACGGTGDVVTTTNNATTTQATTTQATTTQATTQATTTTEVVVIPDPYTALCYLPKGENAKAINVVTQEEVGTLTAGEGIELKGGYFYVVDVVPAEAKNTATTEIGAAVIDKTVAGGWTNVMTNGKVLSYTSYLIRDQESTGKSNGASRRTFTFNSYMDVEALNTALTTSGLGKFGTLKIASVDGDVTSFIFDGGEDEELITDFKWNFVYVGYEGETLSAATGTSYTPLAMNAKELIYSAIDKAYGNDIGTLRALWVQAMDTYGGLPSVEKVDNKYSNTSIQESNVAAWSNCVIPVKYTSALNAYNKLTDDEATIAAALAAANTALAAAQTAFDNAVAANASVKALKEAMDAAYAALDAAKQVTYEATLAHETEKAKNKNSAETAAALEVKNAKTALQAEAQATYDAAKAAFDAAVAADATLAPLSTTLTDATATQKTANTNQTTVNNYKSWSEIYAKFVAAYNELANVALWNTEDMENCPLNKMFAGVEDAVLPSFTYYYDAATETYTVFVTSMIADNMVERFSNNNPVK